MFARRVVLLGEADLIEHGELHLSVSPVTIARLAKQAARAEGSVIICHSHPFPGPVVPSALDLDTEAQLCGRALAARLSPRPVGSLILGPDGASARLYLDQREGHDAAIRIVGESVMVLSRASVGPDQEGGMFDRQVRAWGADGQEAIAEARVVVVGTGGTGSHVITQLAHLGVRKLLLIDPDTIEESNLPRLIGASPADIGKLKAEVLAAAARAISPGADIRVVGASVLDVDPGLLAEADVIFCCTDGHGSRALLTELAQQFCVTVIDLGVEIVASPGGAQAAACGSCGQDRHACTAQAPLTQAWSARNTFRMASARRRDSAATCGGRRSRRHRSWP